MNQNIIRIIYFIWTAIIFQTAYSATPDIEFPEANEIKGEIYSIITCGDYLVIGGDFDSIGTMAAKNIAVRDGFEWNPIGNGLDYSVEELGFYNGDLVAGGWFYFSVWDGTGWNNVYVDGLVKAICEYEDMLIIGGNVHRFIDEKTIRGVLAWDGADFLSLGSGLNYLDGVFYSYPLVYDLAIFGGDLYACGIFDEADGQSCQGIARWDGSNWLPLQNGLSYHGENGPYTMHVYGNKLIVGGFFDVLGTDSISLVASWDGDNWEPLGEGIYSASIGGIYSMVTYDNHLVASGKFSRAGEFEVNNIALWDELQWRPFWDNPQQDDFLYKYHLAENKDCLVASGWDTSGSHLGRWDGIVWTEFDIQTRIEDEDAYSIPEYPGLSQNYPNPFNPRTTMEYSLPRSSAVTITIYNVLGQKIVTLFDGISTAGKYELVWDGTDRTGKPMPGGIYFCRIDAGAFFKTIKMVMIN
nr:T9SS type A sorting domain-containing protein [candidate division Zixibacteria bacterium]